jgi:hypothetical protein
VSPSPSVEVLELSINLHDGADAGVTMQRSGTGVRT